MTLFFLADCTRQAVASGLTPEFSRDRRLHKTSDNPPDN